MADDKLILLTVDTVTAGPLSRRSHSVAVRHYEDILLMTNVVGPQRYVSFSLSDLYDWELREEPDGRKLLIPTKKPAQ